jgi:hypothetical protein
MSKGRRPCKVDVRRDGRFFIVPEDFANNTKQGSVRERSRRKFDLWKQVRGNLKGKNMDFARSLSCLPMLTRGFPSLPLFCLLSSTTTFPSSDNAKIRLRNHRICFPARFLHVYLRLEKSIQKLTISYTITISSTCGCSSPANASPSMKPWR